MYATALQIVKFKHKLASANLTIWDEGPATLGNVLSRNKEKGEGRELMQEIVKFADSRGYDITLMVQRYGDPHVGMDNARLAHWYTQFGFEVVKDYGYPIQMIRLAHWSTRVRKYREEEKK